MGNSSGFVEPLEATALMTVIRHCRGLLPMLNASPTESMRALYNKLCNETFDDTRDFLALHYRFNTRLDNGFWRHCCADTEMGALGPLLEFYRENGPHPAASLLLPSQDRNPFGLEGYLAMLVGNRVPYQARYRIPDPERATWNHILATLRTQAAQGLSVAESLACIRSPQWRWTARNAPLQPG